jgi:hypothetical protein
LFSSCWAWPVLMRNHALRALPNVPLSANRVRLWLPPLLCFQQKQLKHQPAHLQKWLPVLKSAHLNKSQLASMAKRHLRRIVQRLAVARKSVAAQHLLLSRLHRLKNKSTALITRFLRPPNPKAFILVTYQHVISSVKVTGLFLWKVVMKYWAVFHRLLFTEY